MNFLEVRMDILFGQKNVLSHTFYSNPISIKLQVENCYRIKNSSLFQAGTNIRKDNGRRQPLSTAHIKAGESLEEAAKTAAYKVVEAENTSVVVAEAVKEAERISKMAEATDSILQFAKEIFER